MVTRVSRLSVIAALLFLLLACERNDDERVEFITLLEDAPCDMSPGCVAGKDSFSANFLIGPDARALRPFDVRIRLPDDVPVTSVVVRFVMPGMQMGLNRYTLVQGDGGIWRAQVTLPICMSGRSDWIAEFEFVVDQRHLRFDAPFSLEK